jgi:hypothetical protein
MRVAEALSRTVRARADGRGQYCLMHESLQGATFQVEHIIQQCNGGRSDLENLALARALDAIYIKQTGLMRLIRQQASMHGYFTPSCNFGRNILRL